MSLRSTILACATISLVGVLPLAAQAPQGCGNHGQEHARMGKRMATALKLTDEQRSKMETIRAKHAVDLTAKRQSLQEAQKAFRKAYMDPTSSADQIKQLHKAVAEHQFELMMAHRAMRLEQRAILTPEQKAEADKLFQHMDKEGFGHGGKRNGKSMDR